MNFSCYRTMKVRESDKEKEETKLRSKCLVAKKRRVFITLRGEVESVYHLRSAHIKK